MSTGLENIEKLLEGVSLLMRSAAVDWCALEAAHADSPWLVTREGGYVSAAGLSGVTRMFADPEWPALSLALWRAIAAALDAHDIEITHVHDPEGGRAHIGEIVRGQQQRAERAGVPGLAPLLMPPEHIARSSFLERSYIALWTDPSLLTVDERRRDNRIHRKRVAVTGDMRYGQHLDRGFQQLLTIHQQAADGLFRRLGDAGLATVPLSACELLQTLRRCIRPSDLHWRPHLIDDGPGGLDEYPDLAAALWLNLREQLFDLPEERVTRSITRIGDRYYQALGFWLPPRHVTRFSRLQLGAEVPYILRILLSRSGSLLGPRLKTFFAGALGALPGHEYNQYIARAGEQLLEDYQRGEGVLCRMTALTWAASETECRIQTEKLTNALHGWDLAQTRPIYDDPFEGVVSSLPFTRNASPAPRMILPAPLISALPVDFPAEVFSRGLIFRTPAGRPWYYEPMSAEQASWVTHYCGPMRYGKSVLMAADAVQFIIGAGTLPYFGLIEIKPSAEGLFNTLRAGAAPELRERFLYRRLSVEDTINPFDTLLGQRVPAPPHREALVRFLTLHSYSLDAEHPKEQTTELLDALITEVYAQYRDDVHGHPKPYQRGVLAVVDTALERGSRQPETWFEAADTLFSAGESSAAELAHAQAMPLLEDAAQVLVQSDRIRAAYGQAKTDHGEPLIGYVHAQFVSALSRFPALRRPTELHTGRARIIGFDLEGVAPAGTTLRERRITTVYYLLARHLIARYISLRPEHVHYWPERYQRYAHDLIDDAYASRKRMSYDEAHIFEGIAVAEAQLEYDMRVAPSNNWSITYASQQYTDLRRLHEYASTRFVVGAQTDEQIRALADDFSLTAAEQDALRYAIKAPDGQGSHLLALFDTRTYKRVVQHLRFPVSAAFLWAIPTERDNQVIQQRVLDRMPYFEALDALQARFPGGSARADLDRLSGAHPRVTRDELVDRLVEEIIDTITQRAAA